MTLFLQKINCKREKGNEKRRERAKKRREKRMGGRNLIESDNTRVNHDKVLSLLNMIHIRTQGKN